MKAYNEFFEVIRSTDNQPVLIATNSVIAVEPVNSRPELILITVNIIEFNGYNRTISCIKPLFDIKVAMGI